ncbi:MAG: hypothetical protein R2856_36700 [Caldilineaceae bacterium]
MWIVFAPTRASPADGRSYALRFLLSAVSQDIRFGDWAETSLDIEPAVYLRGLPANWIWRRCPPKAGPSPCWSAPPKKSAPSTPN